MKPVAAMAPTLAKITKITSDGFLDKSTETFVVMFAVWLLVTTVNVTGMLYNIGFTQMFAVGLSEHRVDGTDKVKGTSEEEDVAIVPLSKSGSCGKVSDIGDVATEMFVMNILLVEFQLNWNVSWLDTNPAPTWYVFGRTEISVFPSNDDESVWLVDGGTTDCVNPPLLPPPLFGGAV